MPVRSAAWRMPPLLLAAALSAGLLLGCSVPAPERRPGDAAPVGTPSTVGTTTPATATPAARHTPPGSLPTPAPTSPAPAGSGTRDTVPAGVVPAGMLLGAQDGLLPGLRVVSSGSGLGGRGTEPASCPAGTVFHTDDQRSAASRTILRGGSVPGRPGLTASVEQLVVRYTSVAAARASMAERADFLSRCPRRVDVAGTPDGGLVEETIEYRLVQAGYAGLPAGSGLLLSRSSHLKGAANSSDQEIAVLHVGEYVHTLWVGADGKTDSALTLRAATTAVARARRCVELGC